MRTCFIQYLDTTLSYITEVCIKEKETMGFLEGLTSSSLPPSAAWQCAASPSLAASSESGTVCRSADHHPLCRPPCCPGQAEGCVWHSHGPRSSAPSRLQTHGTVETKSNQTGFTPKKLFRTLYLTDCILGRVTDLSDLRAVCRFPPGHPE